ncbi:FK506-binding protein 4 [Golovinomyces cichoracearum]|uniref:peptidylprolyl isomerase n=1 Tax=Golovinomyces cichoracearum TaxID=62708 RepID=A0A420HT09_9PEZI|nr:FK506-binding protein 4 [Golovinomyces cichoracearum]
MPLLPVALYGLEVPCNSPLVAAAPDFPATVSNSPKSMTSTNMPVKLRITMAAIDPDEKVDDKTSPARATLKIIREQNDEDDEETEDYMRAIMAENDSDEDEDNSDKEDKNDGPSDLTKTKKAKKAAAVKKLMESIAEDESDEQMKDAPDSTKPDKKGKSKATESSDDEDEDESSSDEDEFEEFVICTLDPKKNFQQTLDITIGEKENVYFKVTGTHTVYLTGNYLIADDLGLNSHSDEYDSDEDGDYDLSPDEDEMELGSDGESDELDDIENPRITEVDSEEETAPQLVEAPEKKSGKNKRTATEMDEDNSLDSILSKSAKNGATEKAKLSKKQQKKLKKNNGESTVVEAEEPKTDENEKSDRKVQFAKNLEKGPAEKEKPDPKNKNKATLGVKIVDGVKIDDKKLGSGRPCKKNDKVSMRYIGKLVNGTVFDANKKGTPFSFKLGTGEVIRGWDIGVMGMSAGGERRLTIPANKAYGNKATPGIPANSTLIFDIKLLEVK